MRVRAGKHRQPWRIREWLETREMSLADLGAAVGVNRQLASETVRGLRNNRRVLSYLVELGCPDRYLDLPQEMKIREVACPSGAFVFRGSLREAGLP